MSTNNKVTLGPHQISNQGSNQVSNKISWLTESFATGSGYIFGEDTPSFKESPEECEKDAEKFKNKFSLT
jgi:hypothetical protein